MDPSSSYSPLKSFWQIFALFVWVLIALAYLVFFLADLRLDFAQLQVPCSGEECNYLSLSNAEVDVLASWGLSLGPYTFFMLSISVLTVAVFWLLGILILWAQKASRIAWTVSLLLVVMPIATIADADNLAASQPGFFYLAVLLSLLGYIILFLSIYLFPNGRWYPRWAYIPFFVNVVFLGLYPLQTSELISLPDVFIRIQFLVIISLLFLAVFFQIQRYRKVANPIERQQTKWILFGLIVFVLCFLFWLLFFGDVVQISPGAARLLASIFGWTACMVCLTVLPLTMSIAILRFRLWDIDLVIRRTLQYGLLTGILAMVYFGLVVLLQSLVARVGGQQSSIVIVLSTLVIAALFNPLRNRLQFFIDRRFYRAHYDSEHALVRFAMATRDEVDMDNLASELIGLASEALQPSRISLWLVEKTDNSS